MSRRRTIIRLSTVLGSLALVWACGGDSATTPVEPPEPARPTTLTVSPATDELTALGATVQLTATVHDQNDRVMAGATVTWTSSAISVATVDASGLVTAAGNGTATITASAGSASGSAVVTVTQSVASVEVSPSAQTIGLGSTLQLTAEAFDENGEAVAGVEFSWESSDAAVATVDAGGLVTGVAEGVATITASAGSGQGTAKVTVADLDRAALEALYHATDGPNWVNSGNWLTDAPLGDWYGVSTDASGRVVGLDLSGTWDSEAQRPVVHGLSGPIPHDLGNLSNLTTLDLGYNLLSGPILAELGNLANLTTLNLRRNRLTGLILPELGDLTRLETLNLFSNDLSGPIPPELGKLARLRRLLLSTNNLTGPIPPELGSLADLESLYLRNNDLTGPIPESFLELDTLERFRFERNADLCTPGSADFVTWLERIETVSGPYCNESDMKVLDRLYQASEGPNWTNASGWLETPALEEWYGVTANALGRVVTLDLTRNGLTGELPASLGSLALMTALRVGGNALSGRLPLSLAHLLLVELQYPDTGLCVPAEASFRAWLNGISSHEGTSMECGLPSDREVLVALYDVTDGPNWVNTENWLTDAPLGDWYGVYTDASGRLVELDLLRNNLTGQIPPELGNLASLEWLSLARNDLTGPIPPELGSLTSLERLSLSENDLRGPIPPELGRLTSLRWLYLSDNDLAGPIPPELVNLSNLRTLRLNSNDLTGPIPPELGRLTSLGQLYLSGNDLMGPIPPELGNLTSMRGLDLASNNLTGALPPELSGISTLLELSLGNNSGLSGPLPVRLTDLRLETLLTGGTDLCAPSDPGFQAWLQTVHTRRVAPCGSVGTSMAYLTQAVQSREYPVPLVAGEKALLRVFVTTVHPTIAGIPKVRARFYLNGTDRHVTDIPAKTTSIPTEVLEHSLSVSANAEIPGEIVQPGLEMVIEIDPEGTLDAGLGVVKRIPATGRMAVDVREMPVFDLTVIPFLWSADPNRAVVETAEAMEANPEGHELLWDTRTLLPIGDLDVKAHAPVLSSSNSKYALLAETRAIRAMEDGTGHYMGMMSGTVSPGGGVAGRPGRESFTIPNASTMAHELGHNLSLRHAPCGDPLNVDLSFPYPDGSTGVWGYDFRNGGRLVRPEYKDLMSYCEPEWVSDYHFTNALRFRLFDEGASLLAVLAAQGESLLLWGGTDAEGEPFLNPAFVVDSPPVLPDAAGEHRITGRTASGDELFSFDFAMPEVADGDGSSSFAFVLPGEPDWAGNLASITLSGPGGSITLDGDTDLSMTILLDPSTGQVRGILRELLQADVAAALAPQADPESLDVLFSRGIPDAGAWGR